MPRLFLSYRRDDSAGFAGRLADALEHRFGGGSVFRDVDDIRPGEDFAQAIARHLATVEAVLVLIGPRWLAADSHGRKRLHDPDDWVRREIQVALDSGKPVIPVLVGGAPMPAAADLPTDLTGLARLQAAVLSDNGWQADVTRLVTSLGPTPPVPNPGRRKMVQGLLGSLIGLAVLGWVVQTNRQSRDSARNALAGRWTARVKYEWGDEFDEVYEFQPRAGGWGGVATYLTGRLAVEAARVDGEWLTFTTRSQESLGSDRPFRVVIHRYTGHLAGDRIHFTLESSGGYTVHSPVSFVARRTLPGALPQEPDHPN